MDGFPVGRILCIKAYHKVVTGSFMDNKEFKFNNFEGELPSEERLFLMSLEYEATSRLRNKSRVYCNAKFSEEINDWYIEIVVFSGQIPSGYERFVVCKNQKMDGKESRFLFFCEHDELEIGLNAFIEFMDMLPCFAPDLPKEVFSYLPENIGKLLKTVYYCSHPGPLEILYKASLFKIAEALPEVDSYNIQGSTPEKIMGLPLKLLRILNQPDFIDRIKSKRKRQKAHRVYSAFSSRFSKKELPNVWQWKYLETILRDGLNFEWPIFNYFALRDHQDAYSYRQVINFIHLRKELGKYSPCKDFPQEDVEDWDCLCNVLMEMRSFKKSLLHQDDILNKALSQNSRTFYCSDNTYTIVTPTTVSEILKEAIYMHNCLGTYVHPLSKGATTVLFIREKETETPVADVEIKDDRVLQVRAKYNELPSKKVLSFIEKLAEDNNLSYNPNKLVGFYAENRPDIGEYLYDYVMRHQDKFGISGQISIWEMLNPFGE